MVRKHISFGNDTISYVEVNEEKKPLIFFIHGNSGSSLTWTEQMSSPLFSDYHLVAFDLPGHGESGEPESQQGYSLLSFANVLNNAIHSLAGPNEFILVGFSLGTNILGEILSLGTTPNGAVLIGPCIISSPSDIPRVFQPNPNAGAFFSDSVDENILNVLSQDCFASDNEEKKNSFIHDFLKTKSTFRPSLLKTTTEGSYSDEILSCKQLDKPLLIIFGAQDKIVNPDHLDHAELSTWKSSIIKIENAGHFVHHDAPEITNQLVADYVTEMFTTVHA